MSLSLASLTRSRLVVGSYSCSVCACDEQGNRSGRRLLGGELGGDSRVQNEAVAMPEA